MQALQDELTAPLTAEELEILDETLKRSKGMGLFEAHGFLCALISGPQFIPPQIWLGLMRGESSYNTLEDVEIALNLMMRLSNQIARAFDEKDVIWPLVLYSQTEFGGSEEEIEEWYRVEQQALKPWCAGYLQGIAIDGETWERYGGEEMSELLFPIMLLAGDEKELAALLESDGINASIELLQAEAAEHLPYALPMIFDYWRETGIVELLANFPSTKIGRNDPCPCGSGRKYKKCCMDEVITFH